jgi:hypothetical protein
VDVIAIFITAFVTAYAAGRLLHRSPFTWANFAICLISGLISLCIMQLFRSESGETGIALPIFLSCCLTLGLSSLQRQSATER